MAEYYLRSSPSADYNPESLCTHCGSFRDHPHCNQPISTGCGRLLLPYRTKQSKWKKPYPPDSCSLPDTQPKLLPVREKNGVTKQLLLYSFTRGEAAHSFYYLGHKCQSTHIQSVDTATNQRISVGTSWPQAGETKGPGIMECEERTSKNRAVLKMSCEQCQRPPAKTQFHSLRTELRFLWLLWDRAETWQSNLRAKHFTGIVTTMYVCFIQSPTTSPCERQTLQGRDSSQGRTVNGSQMERDF